MEHKSLTKLTTENILTKYKGIIDLNQLAINYCTVHKMSKIHVGKVNYPRKYLQKSIECISTKN